MELILVRGVPGVGKTTYAQLKWHDAVQDGGEPDGDRPYVIATDDFRMDRYGVYQHDQIVGMAVPHLECQQRVREAIAAGCPQVIVHNTFIELWEIDPYVKISEQAGILLRVLRMPEIDAQTSYDRNTHNVPMHVIERFIERMQDYPGEVLLD